MLKPIRTFIAIPLNKELQLYYTSVINEFKTKSGIKKIRWTKPENFHLSLRFIGNTLPDECTAIQKDLKKKIAAINPFSLELRKVVFFPSIYRARVVGVSARITEELGQLVALINEVVTNLGFEIEKRPFMPHLTLGRLKYPQKMSFNDFEIEPQNMTVNEVIFYRSELMSNGTVYSKLATFLLD